MQMIRLCRAVERSSLYKKRKAPASNAKWYNETCINGCSNILKAVFETVEAGEKIRMVSGLLQSKGRLNNPRRIAQIHRSRCRII
jgi:hypothetical protein